jgi:hypothetical protein
MASRSNSEPVEEPRGDSSEPGFEDSKTRQIPAERVGQVSRPPAKPSEDRDTLSLDPSELPTPAQHRLNTAELTPPPLEETPAPYSLAPEPHTDKNVRRGPRTSPIEYFKGWPAAAGLAAGAIVVAAIAVVAASPFSRAELLIRSEATPTANLDSTRAQNGRMVLPGDAKAIAQGLLDSRDSKFDERARAVLRNAHAIEMLDVSGDGAADIMAATSDGRGALIDGKSGELLLEGTGQFPDAERPVHWHLENDRLVLVYPHDGTGETRMTWKLSARARKNSDVLMKLWKERRPPAAAAIGPQP